MLYIYYDTGIRNAYCIFNLSGKSILNVIPECSEAVTMTFRNPR